jgi:hypothetical protein
VSIKKNKIIRGQSAKEIHEEINNPDRMKSSIDFFKKALLNAKKYEDRKK